MRMGMSPVREGWSRWSAGSVVLVLLVLPVGARAGYDLASAALQLGGVGGEPALADGSGGAAGQRLAASDNDRTWAVPGQRDGGMSGKSRADCNSNGVSDDLDIAGGTSADCNSDGVPDECAHCAAVDVVFVLDTSGSMSDELAWLCSQIDDVIADLVQSGIEVHSEILSIGDGALREGEADELPPGVLPGGGRLRDNCWTDSVPGRYGTTVPGLAEELGACSAMPNAEGFREDWATASAVVAAKKTWVPGAVRIIIPLTDEGPRCGNPVSDPGVDRDAVEHAIPFVSANQVVVSPVIGTPYDAEVVALATELANGGGPGGAVQLTNGLDLGGLIRQVITEACVAAMDCNTNGVLDECDITFGTSSDCELNGVPDECEPDCNGNGVADGCDIIGGMGTDYNGDGILDECVPCAAVDVVFLVDGGWWCSRRGHSQRDDPFGLFDLCDVIDGVITDLRQGGMTVNSEVLSTCPLSYYNYYCLVPYYERGKDESGELAAGSSRGGGSPGEVCTTDDVPNRYGTTAPGLPEVLGTCSANPDDLANCEDWGPAVAIVAANKAWNPGAIRVVVPVVDAGPRCGDPVDDPGADRDAIDHAEPFVSSNSVIVFPVLADPYDEKLPGLAADMASNGSSGGAVLYASDPGFDLAGMIRQLVASSGCAPADDCNHNGQPDLSDIRKGISNDSNGDSIPDECANEDCTATWDGFEMGVFQVGVGLDGLDSNTDGNTWSDPDGGWTTEIGTCGTSGGAKVIAGRGDDSAPGGLRNWVRSEYFQGSRAGNLPPAPAEKTVGFDYRVDRIDAEHDVRMVLYDGLTDEAALTICWTSTQSDLGSNGVVPGHIWIIDGGDLSYHDTGVAVVADTCGRMEITYRLVDRRVTVKIGGVSRFASAAAHPSVGRLDYFRAGSVTHHSATAGGPVATLTLDNFEVCTFPAPVSCSVYGSEDCNSNGVCDSFELSSTTDRNGNGRLDGCESPCNDCNFNHIVDDAEIAAGSAPDSNSNGVIDWCEKTPNATTKVLEGFEDFVVGVPFDGQFGWHEDHVGQWTSAVISDENTNSSANPTGMPSEGSRYLKIMAADPANQNVGFIVSPRQSFGDQDIEEWAWDMIIQGTEAGGGGYKRGIGRVVIGVMDLCEYGPPRIDDLASIGDVSGAFNTSAPGAWTNNEFQISGQSATYTGDSGRGALWNQTSQGNYTAENTTQTVLVGPLGANPHKWAERFTVRMRIMNTTGQTQVWTADYNSALMKRATGDQWPDWTVLPSSQVLTEGGDRQLIIGVYPIIESGTGNVFVPAFGDDGKGRVFVDNIRYTTANDCNHNSLAEGNATLLGSGANETWGTTALDANADYIPDTCQDCNTNGVLDTTEIAGKDLNGNGILDECDINPHLKPREGKPYAGCIGYFNGAECKALFGRAVNETNRQGGGCCDANANGVPDDYEVTQGSGTDCNGNGCLDAAEIAQGSAPDVNTNWVIDTCEVDCNHNGVLDSIDLSGGTSDDNYPFVPPSTAGDGVPDECCTAAMSPPCTCTGPDFSGDGDVDAADYAFMQRCAGAVAGPSSELIGNPATGVLCKRCRCACADLNSDGQVNDADVTLFWLQVSGPKVGDGNGPPYKR